MTEEEDMEHTVLQLLENANRRAGKQIALLDDKYQLTYEEYPLCGFVLGSFVQREFLCAVKLQGE